MADLALLGGNERSSAGTRTDRSRGQILLVTALVLGVSFVALALILNSAIFTENLASRGDSTGADEVVIYHNQLDHGVGDVVSYETRNATTSDTHATIFGRIETGVGDADSIVVRRHAKRGVVANVSIADHREGSRIFQTNGSRNFSDGTNQDDWTLANDVGGTRAFRLNVTGHPGTEQFVVRVTDVSDPWALSVRDTGTTDLEVVVDNGTGSEQTCATTATPVPIDLTAGTVAGTECEALAFAEATDGSYDVAFENGTQVTGTYSLVVDDPSIATSPIPSRFGNSGDPTVTPTVYNLTLGYQYHTSELVVEKELRVAPGEPNGR